MAHRLIVNGELILYGVVGGGFFFEDGFTAGEVVSALGEMSGDITVRMNSGGGFAWDGIAIFNALRAHQGRITIKVDAIAASAASIILMAGDERVVPPSAMVMIHNASGFTVGTADDHRKQVDVLDKLDGQMAQVYAEASDTKIGRIKQMMQEETWLTGEEAVAAGFADQAPKDESNVEAALFDYRIYAKAPERLKQMVASIQFNNAPADAGRKPRGRAAHQPGTQENSMTDAEKAAAEKLAADQKAKTEADAAAKLAADKAAADAAAASAAQKGSADDAVKAERARASDIMAACQLAHKPEKAAAFIAEGKSLGEVLAALQAERPVGDDVNARNKQSAAEVNASWGKHVDRINARLPNGRTA